MNLLHARTLRIGRALMCLSLLAAPALAGPGDAVPLSAPGETLLKRALGEAATPAAPGAGRSLFESVLASDAFRSGQAGCFDVHVLAGQGGAAHKEADRTKAQVLKTLAPAAALVAKCWPAGGGLISGCRFPVVLVSSRVDYLQVLALLEHCERAGYSGWAPANTLEAGEVQTAEVARTWEVQVFDLSHSSIAGRRAAWLEHGVGYYSLAFVANRALRCGAWGLVPPWLQSGLADELDIAAYGKAWVGDESWVSQTPGWHRSGWSGFVPQGHMPPAPLTGPPADLGTTVTKTGNPWLDTQASTSRHWSQLVADLATAAPASFARAAESESFLPRDRAAARCLLHLMLAGPEGAGTLTARLDDPQATPAHGMPDSDPLPLIFSRALGGVPEVERLEALDTRSLLQELGRADLIEWLDSVHAGEALELNDHRAQSAWLYEQAFPPPRRAELFNVFLSIEYSQQMAQWRALGPHLDAGLRAALKSRRSFPAGSRELATAAGALRSGLALPPQAAAGVAQPSRTRSR